MKQLPLMSAAAGLRIVMARYGQWDGCLRVTVTVCDNDQLWRIIELG